MADVVQLQLTDEVCTLPVHQRHLDSVVPGGLPHVPGKLLQGPRHPRCVTRAVHAPWFIWEGLKHCTKCIKAAAGLQTLTAGVL